MALAVSFAPAAPAQAARPTRAAAPAAANSSEGFDAVLARTAEGRADEEVRPIDGVDDLDEQEEPAEPVDVSAMTVCLETASRIVPPLEVVAATSESEMEDSGDGLPGDQQSTVAAPELKATGDASAAIAVPDAAAQCPPAQAAMIERSPTLALAQERGSAVSEDAQAVVPVEIVRKGEDAAVGDSLLAGRTPQPARTTANPSSGPIRSSAPRTEARAAAQVIVAEALSSATAVRSEIAPQGTAVATAPLLPGHVATGGEAAPGSAKARPALAPVDATAVDTALSELPVPTQSQGRREGGNPSHEQGPPQGRAPALGHAGVPASMIFPGQATFAAAMERALPLAQVLPPGFTGRTLETVVPQVVRSMHLQVTAGGGDMTLTLTPEHLGTVTIELRVDQQRVSASLGADTAAVRGWIAAHEQDLKAGLADLGLQLDEFVVRDEDPREQKDQADGQPTKQRRKRDKVEEPVFEVQA